MFISKIYLKQEYQFYAVAELCHDFNDTSSYNVQATKKKKCGTSADWQFRLPAYGKGEGAEVLKCRIKFGLELSIHSQTSVV